MSTSTLEKSTFRPADQRGHTQIGWLNSWHSFSFGGYHDPTNMGYRNLRVINDDRVAPSQGFGTHPHRDMEILTWVLDGQLAHRDSMGHASTLGTGSVQLMSAGSGVTHSEFNGSDAAPVHFLQIWVMPTQRGTTPRYGEATPDPATRRNRFAPLATPDGRDGSLTIGADAHVYVADIEPGQTVTLALPTGRVAYAHLATGQANLQGHTASAGDAVTVEGTSELAVSAPADAAGHAQVIAFVLPE